MKSFVSFLSALLLTSLVCAQSVPNGGTITQGQVWTAPQWTSAWQSKADASNGSLNNPSINGVPIPTYLDTHVFSEAPTNQQFAPAANIQRLNDRVMVGDAAVNDGLFPNVTKDWLSAFQTSQAGGPANGTLLGVQMAVLGDQTTPIGGGFLSGARTLNNGVNGAALATTSIVVNDNAPASNNNEAWAYYGEAHRMNNNVSSAVGMELDVVERGAALQFQPYSTGAIGTIGYISAAGAGLSAVGQLNATAAFVVGSNPMAFNKGIVFQSNSIAGTNGVTGSGYAIAMAKGHVVSWWAPGGVQTGTIIGSGTTNANAVGIDLDENFLQITAQSGLAHTRFTGVPGAVNYLNILHSATGTPIVLQAQGSDTNVSINFVPQGTGKVQINGASLNPVLAGTTGSIGGGALTVGTCTSGTVAVANSTTAMAVAASPVSYPGDGIYWVGYVSAAGTVTVKVCATASITPTASAYNVRVLQ